MNVYQTAMFKAACSAKLRLLQAICFIEGTTRKHDESLYNTELRHIQAFLERPYMDFRERNNRLSQIVDVLEPAELEALYNGLDVENEAP